MKPTFHGICCSYDPNIPTSPTGFTWKQLAKYRENNYREILRLKGITNPTFEQLLVWDGYPEPYSKYKRMLTKGISENHFIAFDVETANSNRDSICSIGIVEVLNSEIVNERHWYIKPEPFIMSFHNSNKHKISKNLLVDAPSFEEVWHEIEPFFKIGHAVAHNIGFDKTCITTSLERTGKKLENIQFLCTLRLSKLAYKLENYKLPTICEHIGHELEKHHDAISDAKGCAAIYLDLIDNAEELEEEAEAEAETKRKASNKIRYKRTINIPIADLKEKTEVITNKLSGYVICFTGELNNITRDEARKIVFENGGEITSSVTNKTTHLVSGYYEEKTAKEKRADELGIETIFEDDFLKLIN